MTKAELPDELEHVVTKDLSRRNWASFASSVGANVVANVATGGVVYAYARLTGALKSNDVTDSFDVLVVVALVALAVGGVVVAARHRR